MTDGPQKRRADCALYLSDLLFCATLEPEELAQLCACSHMVSLRRGESISPDVVTHAPILSIESGELSLQHVLHDGRRSIAAFFVCGDILDLRHSDENRLGSLIALSDLRFCKLAPAVFDKILDNNRAAHDVVWSNLQGQVYRSFSHVADLTNKKALEKLASFILECRNRSPHAFLKNHVNIPFRRRDVAEYLGMQPETISRSFRELEAREIIFVKETSVVQVRKLPDLRLIANGARDETHGAGVKVLRMGT